MTELAILGALLAAGFGAIGIAKVRAVKPMREAAARLGFTVKAYRGIGLLELAGALGVLLGLVVRPIGWLAAVGLLLLLVGAVVSHVRHRGSLKEFVPAVVFGAADAAYLGLSLATAH